MGRHIDLHKALIKEGIHTERELVKIIEAITKQLIKSEVDLMALIAQYSELPMSVTQLAQLAEMKIRLSEIRVIKKSVLSILKKSTNSLLLATMEMQTMIN